MKQYRMIVAMTVLATAALTYPYSTTGTKWGIGPNVATHLAGFEGTPGFATWSIMPAGLGVAAFGDVHGGLLTGDFASLLGGPTMTEEIAMLTSVFDTWSSVSGISFLGPVTDGGVFGGAPEFLGGSLGDLRFGVIGGFATPAELAHGIGPGTEALYGPGGTVAGDVHVNITKTWVDDPFDPPGDPIYDLHTVLLHEVGHALGLGHTGVPGAVMAPAYAGGKRTLTADDIDGIKFIYGPVPEPATMAGLGLGFAWLLRRRKSKAR